MVGWRSGEESILPRFPRFHRARSARIFHRIFLLYLFARASFFFHFIYCIFASVVASPPLLVPERDNAPFRGLESRLVFVFVGRSRGRMSKWKPEMLRLTIVGDFVGNGSLIGRHCHERGSTSRTRSRVSIAPNVRMRAYIHTYMYTFIYRYSVIKLYFFLF